IQEGLANRITPFYTKDTEVEELTGASNLRNFDTERTYNSVVKYYKFGGVSTKGIYLDETVMRMCYTHRRLLSTLASKLLAKGDKQKALKIANICEKEIPAYNVPRTFQDQGLLLATVYAQTGDKAKAKAIITDYLKYSEQYMAYYSQLPHGANTSVNPMLYIYMLGQCSEAAMDVDENWANKLKSQALQLQEAYK
ncbi:MAG: hypothetical protein HUK07_07130, partial [Bacteroidaceae bacterium]|nr:hypothetical protein [Bacteroidaceae bacterium]